jgi:hypothetical protein
LLPTIADDNVEKFREYVKKETIPWVKEFVMYMAATFGSSEFLKVFVEDSNEGKLTTVIEFDTILNFAAGNGFNFNFYIYIYIYIFIFIFINIYIYIYIFNFIFIFIFFFSFFF